jgi:hypothetical protein
MAKNKFQFDFDALSDIIEKLDKAGAELEKVLTEVLEDTAEEITQDTITALAPAYLPAGGKYSTGETLASVIRNPKVEQKGSILEIGVGFDKSKPGAGGWLITGTPKMQPDQQLAKIFQTKKYANKINDEIKKELQKELDKLGG